MDIVCFKNTLLNMPLVNRTQFHILPSLNLISVISKNSVRPAFSLVDASLFEEVPGSDLLSTFVMLFTLQTL